MTEGQDPRPPRSPFSERVAGFVVAGLLSVFIGLPVACGTTYLRTGQRACLPWKNQIVELMTSTVGLTMALLWARGSKP